MRVEEKLHFNPDDIPSAHEAEEIRRRRYLIANVARRLNGLFLQADQARGYGFELEIATLFKIEGLTYEASYRRRGTQIDGALELDGWIYLVETRWRRGRASWKDFVALRTNVKRSSRQTMGLFISVNGWTAGALEVLKSDPDQAVIVMDGSDLGVVLGGLLRLEPVLRAKARHLALHGEPYLPASDLVTGPTQAPGD